MSRSLDECDAILDLACDCYRMSVVKTRWYGDNIGCRYRVCPNGICGFHKWVDPPICSRGRDAMRELQDRHHAEMENKRRRMDALAAWYQARLEVEKRKFKESLAGLSILCDVVKDVVLESTELDVPPPEFVWAEDVADVEEWAADVGDDQEWE